MEDPRPASAAGAPGAALATGDRQGPAAVYARHLRREVQYLLDLGALVTAFCLAYLLRFEFSIPPDNLSFGLVQLPIVVLLQFLILLLLGVYQFVWRYVGMREIGTFLRAAAYSATPLLLSRLGLPEEFLPWKVPLSIIFMDTVLAFGALLAIRVLRRAVYERYERDRSRTDTRFEAAPRRALLIGAGQVGVVAAREMQRGYRLLPVGFVDDDPRKLDSVIQGVRVLGATGDLPRLLAEHAIDLVIITIAAPGSSTVREIFNVCERAGVRVQIVPALHEILGGEVAISRFRNVEIEDLLGREPVRLDEDELRRFLTGRGVLLTGAGGSIGGELARQIARYNPLRLVLVERSEAALFAIEFELRKLWPDLRLEPFLGDVGDAARMRDAFTRFRPAVVFHAAAHKHVTMLERHPGEAMRNNVLATEALGRVAGECGADTFVLVSTDKAVRPSSMMGASKRVAELVVQDLDRRFERTQFLAVRFGNVLGSTGSVVPIFRDQIARGGPVTVTHPEAARYFMTPAEAAQLVIEAGAIGRGGEILILDMGQPVQVLDLAKDMITLSGRRPFDDVPITFTGLRPGEKLTEELQLAAENIERTVHPKVYRGKLAAYPAERIERALAELAGLTAAGQEGELRGYLGRLLPEADLERRADHPVAEVAAAVRPTIH